MSAFPEPWFHLHSFWCASCCQCIWHSIWPCLQHRRYMITSRKCHDIMLLTVGIFIFFQGVKSTHSVNDLLSKVSRCAGVVEYKAHSDPEGQWKWDQKVTPFHMLIFNSWGFFLLLYALNADACFCPTPHEVFRKDTWFVLSLGSALSLWESHPPSGVLTNIVLA